MYIIVHFYVSICIYIYTDYIQLVYKYKNDTNMFIYITLCIYIDTHKTSGFNKHII